MRAGESILIVDPNAATRARLQRLLADRGYTVLQVDSFDAALTALERDAWSFVIAAWALGERSGVQLVAAFQALAPESLVIIAGDGGQEMALAALRGGAGDYLPTPIDATELAAALERAARIQAARSQGDARAHALATRLAHARAAQASIAQRAGLGDRRHGDRPGAAGLQDRLHGITEVPVVLDQQRGDAVQVGQRLGGGHGEDARPLAVPTAVLWPC